jgi:4-hydroxy-tetrahydrodipicolinate reductase
VIRVALAGCRGRMGRVVEEGLRHADGVEYVGGFGREDDPVAFLRDARPQVLVDFTRAEPAVRNALVAAESRVAPLVAASNVPPADVDRIEAACRAHGVGGMVAPALSLGGVLMSKLAELIMPFSEGVEIIEMHYPGKADAPSGTARDAARRLAKHKGRSFSPHPSATVTMPGVRGGSEDGVAVHSLRLPGLFGEHQIVFGMHGHTLTIINREHTRDCVMPGVLLAIAHVAAGPRFYRALDEIDELRLTAGP